ncbi:hypothetical protein IJI94_00855 [Candidatus Saccharibacteria bacterium]|nr:hypothetical protein [Candidatus Saccharibacteria bacterium]
MDKSSKEIYREGCWSVELRERNNHLGKKPWILFQGNEMFSWNGEKLRQRGCLSELMIPPNVLKAAKNALSV